MRRINGKQVNVPFVFCASPIIIDKRQAWGAADENLQNAPDGAYLKMSSPTEVSHLVQPNKDKSAPVGWKPGDSPGLFTKLPIWIEEQVVEPGTTVSVKTADGEMQYTFSVPAVVCYNGDENGPNLEDSWVQPLKEVKKNYEYEPATTTV